AVVALLGAGNDAVAARGRRAVGVAAVVVDEVAVITPFAGGLDAVAAHLAAARRLAHAAPPGLDRAERVAAVVGDDVAVVARLARRDDAVAARGRRAVGVAPIAVDEIAVVALV